MAAGVNPPVAQLNMQLLAAVVEERLRERGISQREAAREIGVSASLVTRITQKQSMYADNLVAVLDWLDLPLEKFVVPVPAKPSRAGLVKLSIVNHFLATMGNTEQARALSRACTTILDAATPQDPDTVPVEHEVGWRDSGEYRVDIYNFGELPSARVTHTLTGYVETNADTVSGTVNADRAYEKLRRRLAETVTCPECHETVCDPGCPCETIRGRHSE